MFRKFGKVLFLMLLIASLVAAIFTSNARAETPALVVVVSVDQLAYEYLMRFERNFSNEGFFRQCSTRGAWFENCHHRHAYTFTAPGHAVQLTGCYPHEHGIIDNDWYDRAARKKKYCVSDSTVKIIGASSDDKPVSPRNLQADTVGDRLKLASSGQSKVFGVAIKDRASILMAGHFADAAFWMSDNGEWITSDYYRSDLPGYLAELNSSKQIRTYAGAEWKRLLPADKYLHGVEEQSQFERPYGGLLRDFPHVLDQGDSKLFVKQLAGSPFGNDATLHAAAKVLVAEQLGADAWPDLLCVNLSSNDYVGHSYGPHSLEVEDMTYRTDLQLAEFYKFVNDTLAGKPWLMVLTADHGVAPIPELVDSKKRLPASRKTLGASGARGYEEIAAAIDARLKQAFKIDDEKSPSLVQMVTDSELYFDREHKEWTPERLSQAQRIALNYLAELPAIAGAATRDQLLSGGVTTKLERQFYASFHPARSGDVLFALQPYNITGEAGATHGSPWEYDTHVPLLFLAGGNGASDLIQPGVYGQSVAPAMIAPTLSRLLRVTPPSKCVEEPLTMLAK